VKYDGYRLIVVRDGDRLRLFTRNGHDWSGRYPWIVESALKNRHSQFVIDGECLGRATLATLLCLRLVPAHRLVSLGKMSDRSSTLRLERAT
jgi:hypothetical protein